MQKSKSKSLFVGVGALIILAIIVGILMLKDKSVLVSGEQASEMFSTKEVQSVSSDEEYVYFRVDNTPYKVYVHSLPLSVWSLKYPVSAKQHSIVSGIISDIGLFVVLLLGIAVLLRALSLSFGKSKQAVLESYQTPSHAQTSFLSQSQPTSPTPSAFVPIPVQQVGFDDVAGISEVKEELLEVVDYLKNPKFYQEHGIRLPKGVLLVGPPGVGKTLIAKAMAKEAGVPFFYQSGSSFVQIYVGMGAKRVRELFLQAKAKAPSIIFIDEIDSVGKARGNTRSDEREATLNQLLTEMDGFEDSNGVIVIAATNKIEVLDEALLRSGRFDRRIYVELPNLKEREHILELYLRNKTHTLDVNAIARLCVGFSGAALAALINESALHALRRKSKKIEQEDILATKDKVLIGKKKTMSLSENEKHILSLYQAAKGLSAYWLEVEFDKISLVGESFKMSDKQLVSKQDLNNQIKVALSGNVALELIYNQSFSNAKDDIQYAKDIATQMCEDYGMGSKILSDSGDVIRILEDAREDVKDFVISSKALLLEIAKILSVNERLSKEEIKSLYERANT